MKMLSLFCTAVFLTFTVARSQQVSHADLTGIWDQDYGKHRPTMIFVSDSGVKFSFKGHTGSTKKYDYVLNNSNVPAIMTVYKKPNHRKVRNEYLIQFINTDTLKLQVLLKKSPRDHFDEDHPKKIITLTRRK